MGPEGTEPAKAGPATAIVVAGDEETRVLLRGLLRLHRFQVLGEAEGARAGIHLVHAHRPRIVVADAVLTEGSFGELVAESRAAVPGIRVILVTPGSRTLPGTSGPTEPDVVLTRPFRIRQFAEALSGTPVPSVPP